MRTATDEQLPVILLVDDDDATRAALLEAVDHRYGHDYDAIAEAPRPTRSTASRSSTTQDGRSR